MIQICVQDRVLCVLNSWLSIYVYEYQCTPIGRNRLSAEPMAGRWQSLRKIEYVRQGCFAFGPRCNPGTPSWIGLPMWPPCPGCCLAQHLDLALGHGPELRIPAPLRCGEGKGHLEQYGRKCLHAHENHFLFALTMSRCRRSRARSSKLSEN